MESEIAKVYGNRVRVRVCGLCWIAEKLLLVNHQMNTKNDGFWAPPGGGVDFGESLEETLVREFREETGLIIEPGKFAFGCELIKAPLHAVELFFEAAPVGGTLQKGFDPELQIIRQVMPLAWEEIAALPGDQVHGILKMVRHPQELKELYGFYRI